MVSNAAERSRRQRQESFCEPIALMRWLTVEDNEHKKAFLVITVTLNRAYTTDRPALILSCSICIPNSKCLASAIPELERSCIVFNDGRATITSPHWGHFIIRRMALALVNLYYFINVSSFTRFTDSSWMLLYSQLDLYSYACSIISTGITLPNNNEGSRQLNTVT